MMDGKDLLGPGVYLLLDGDNVVYVGQSICLIGRIASHIQDKSKQFDDFRIVPCATSELDAKEREWIKLHRPALNRNHNGTCSHLTAACIEQAGGIYRVAEELGVTRQAVEQWIGADRIPAERAHSVPRGPAGDLASCYRSTTGRSLHLRGVISGRGEAVDWLDVRRSSAVTLGTWGCLTGCQSFCRRGSVPLSGGGL